MKNKEKAIVVGAGLVGSLWSILLAKRGYEVALYERRSDVRKKGFIGGRSINLAMSHRGWKALEKAGVDQKIRDLSIPMHGRIMHSTTGELTFQPYGKKNEAIYSVSRGGLNLELLRIAGTFDNVTMNFDEKCLGVNTKTKEVEFSNYSTKEKTSQQSDLIFGTDGAFSAIRDSLQRRPRFDYSQDYLEHGYKELSIPPLPNGDFALDKNALHIWPRGHFMLIALPNIDGSFTCTLFLPFEGEVSFENLKTDETVLEFFEKYFADTIPLIPSLLEEFKENPTSALVTVKCSPWSYENKVMLMGDASHAIVPFYGQGMNSGFEDCTVLDELIDINNGDWVETFKEFNEARIPDANAISELAKRNFVEMRDSVGNDLFLLRKKIEKHLNKKYPKQFLPVYSMVSFSHIRYSEALAELDRQDRLFDHILAIDDIKNNWADNPQVDVVFQEWHEKN
mgnify:FL=1